MPSQVEKVNKMEFYHDITVRLRWRDGDGKHNPKRIKQVITANLPTIKLTGFKSPQKVCKWEYLGDKFWRPECDGQRNNGSGGLYCTYCGGKIKVWNWKED